MTSAPHRTKQEFGRPKEPAWEEVKLVEGRPGVWQWKWQHDVWSLRDPAWGLLETEERKMTWMKLESSTGQNDSLAVSSGPPDEDLPQRLSPGCSARPQAPANAGPSAWSPSPHFPFLLAPHLGRATMPLFPRRLSWFSSWKTGSLQSSPSGLLLKILWSPCPCSSFGLNELRTKLWAPWRTGHASYRLKRLVTGAGDRGRGGETEGGGGRGGAVGEEDRWWRKENWGIRQ